MDLVTWASSPYTVATAGNHLCGCSTGVPAANATTGLPKRVDDALCNAPCPADATETCGDGANQTAVSAYTFACTAVPAPLRQPICNLNFSQWWNGSDVTYKQYIDCFGRGDTSYASLYINDHFAIQPHYAVLCNITREQWYCDYAAANLAAYAMGGAQGGYHCYEPVLAYQAVVDGTGLKDAGLNATALAKFKALVVAGCGSQAGHSAKVENHGIDAALQQAYAPRVFPDLLNNSNVRGWKGEAEQVYTNWMHAHALDESAINYDGISIVRLVALLRLGASNNVDVASFPEGPSDLKSNKFKAFLYEFADSITVRACSCVRTCLGACVCVLASDQVTLGARVPVLCAMCVDVTRRRVVSATTAAGCRTMARVSAMGHTSTASSSSRAPQVSSTLTTRPPSTLSGPRAPCGVTWACGMTLVRSTGRLRLRTQRS